VNSTLQLFPCPDPDCPTSDIDVWADDVLEDPYQTYSELRELGPVVWLSRVNAFAFSQYAEIRNALQDHETYSSASGVGMDPVFNGRSNNGILTSDPPIHDSRRRVLNPQLVPRALAPHEGIIRMRADELVETCVAMGTFDAAADLAQPYSVNLVADLVGLPIEGREHLLPRAEAAFNTFGPGNARMAAALNGLRDLYEYSQHTAVPGNLTPGRWGAQIYEAATRGELEPEACPGLMLAYIWAGMDTTVNAIASAVALFAEHPGQWDLLRSDPSLLLSAFNEVLRFHAPVQRFARCTTVDVVVAGISIPAGSRVALFFGSGNRDPLNYADPDRFDITRNPVDHLSFGRGVHRCVGAPLAHLEGQAVIASLALRVTRFEEVSITWRKNNALHGPKECVVRAHT
jgi:cytochrome P450